MSESLTAKYPRDFDAEDCDDFLAFLDRKHVSNIVRNMLDSLIVLSSDATIMFANNATEEMLGCDSSELIGKPFGPLVADDNLEFFKCLRSIFTKGPVKGFNLNYIHSAGYNIPVSVNGSALRDDRGVIIGLIIVARDERETLRLIAELEKSNALLEQRVKERTAEMESAYMSLKKIQAMLIQNEKMASVGQLAAGIAHEINTPAGYALSNLSVLEGYVKDIAGLMKSYQDVIAVLLKEKGDNALIDEIAGLEKSIDLPFIMDDLGRLTRESRTGIERVKNIVANIRDFSRIDSDELAAADINQCIEKTLSVIAGEIKEDIRVIKDYGELPSIICRPAELNHAFMNLILNAAQAISGIGEIKIKTRMSSAADVMEITISDTGCGISEENMQKIFDPFFTTKPVGKGTGIGLFAVYGIVRQHHGGIKVNSRQGEGTEFTITLPAGGK